MFRKKCEYKVEICFDIIVGFIYLGLKGKLNDDIKKSCNVRIIYEISYLRF